MASDVPFHASLTTPHEQKKLNLSKVMSLAQGHRAGKVR